MFILQSERQIWWPVTINVPADDGYIDPVTIKVKFVARSVDEMPALMDRAAKIDTSEGGAATASAMADLIGEIIRDWDGIGAPDPDKPDAPVQKLAFTKDNLRRFIVHPGVFMAVMQAYREFMMGLGKEREKN